MSQFYEVFFDEAEELLAEAERLLLGINIANPDNEELNAIFRAAHSIKGGAATFGFMDMTEITHVLENLLDKIRKHEMSLTAEHVDAFLAAKDVLKMELDGHRLATEVDEEQVADVKMMLKQLSEAGAVSTPVVAPVATAPTPQPAEPIVKDSIETAMPDGMSCFNIVMPDITEKDVENLQEELGLLGDATVSKQADGRFVISLTTDSSQDDIVSICSFIVDPDDLVITLKSDAPVVSAPPAEEVKSGVATAVETQVDTSTKVLVQEEVGYGLFEEEGKEKQEEGYGFFAPFQPHPDAVKANLIGDDTALTLANSGTTSAQLATAVKTEVAASTASQEADRRNAGRREADKAPASAEASSIRVGVEKVDQLINLVGELVITQAMIEQRISAGSGS